MLKKVVVRFWGVRGSMAAPGPETVRYGGNTACLEIEADDARIICDAGTGIRPLGLDLINRFAGKAIEASILLSHLHWDHFIGLPFFKPLYSVKNSFEIIGPGLEGMSFRNALSRAMRPPYFPVPFSDVPASLKFRTIHEKNSKIRGILVNTFKVNHPGGAFGYRFHFSGGRSLVHITDNEPSNGANMAELVEMIRGADVMIHDAQYTPQNYLDKKGWGHSPFTYPIELAERAGIRRLYLFHFDPEDDDGHLRAVLGEVNRWIKSKGMKVRCGLSREGSSFEL